MSALTEGGDLWLFGYGSLIWKPPPHYGCPSCVSCDVATSDAVVDLRVPGYIEGYVRRFWQASEDHRGTPEAPGRVVTLLDRKFWETLTDHHADAPPLTWGAAYRIPAPKVAEVQEYLDIREINGYSMQYVPFLPAPSFKTDERLETPIPCLVYIGLPDNPQFVGPQDPQQLAEHIVTHEGPSGLNKDYLYELDTALSQLSAESQDEHVHDLARRCRQIEANRS